MPVSGDGIPTSDFFLFVLFGSSGFSAPGGFFVPESGLESAECSIIFSEWLFIWT